VYFEVAERPVQKQRAARGKNNNCYNPSRSEEKEFASIVKDIFVEHLGRVPTFQRTQALTVDVRFLFFLIKAPPFLLLPILTISSNSFSML
jgi:hypothetical protein